MFHYQLILAYDGTAYGGWAVQPNAVTIQQLVQGAFSTLLRLPVLVTGSGRTDAGVHALAQSAHFSHSEPVNIFRLFGGLNGLLPRDIRVKEIRPASPDFHARKSALRKIYRYYLTLGPVCNPFTRNYSWHISSQFNLAAVREAASYFLGTRDFSSFANIGCHRDREKDTVRTIYRLDIVMTEDGLYFEFEGDGFLYKMVRNIVGALVESGLGNCNPSQIPNILAACDRKAAGRTAPPQGLFLVKVIY